MTDMMKECCSEAGMPDFDQMKNFMERCGKTQFTDDEIKAMREFCAQRGKPDAEKMTQLMKKCGC